MRACGWCGAPATKRILTRRADADDLVVTLWCDDDAAEAERGIKVLFALGTCAGYDIESL